MNGFGRLPLRHGSITLVMIVIASVVAIPHWGSSPLFAQVAPTPALTESRNVGLYAAIHGGGSWRGTFPPLIVSCFFHWISANWVEL